MCSRYLTGAVALALIGQAIAQDWQNDVNVSMCNWAEFRANVIRNTIYLDGGSLWWEFGLSDGTYGVPQNDGNVGGYVYALNLGQSFNSTSNLTALFQGIPKLNGAANNLESNYIDGVMFANDDLYILYGGLTLPTASQQPPAANAILEYEAYNPAPSSSAFSPGFLSESLPTNITRYVTNGAGVSAQNVGYYFSGVRGEDWGPIQNDYQSANTTANSLISVNMTDAGNAQWANTTLPDSIPGRANAELVWIPFSESGVLVAIGGVINPVTLTPGQALTDAQAAASEKTNPTFMETVSVYDIANQTWYLQNTTGDIPPPLTLFCSVVAAAQDGSSYNVYIYGGFNGINETTTSDDVYILSVPSFTWVHAYSGQHAHSRSGHKCFAAYPDQMFVLGGVFEGNSAVCVEGGIIQVFNLNTLAFQDSYNPQTYSEYVVPSVLTAKIGGTGQGGATKTSPTDWNNEALAGVFQSRYTQTIPTYYPYAPDNAAASNASTTPSTTSVPHSGGGLPGWAGAIIGVLLGLFLIVSGALGWLWYRRRQNKGGSTGYGSNKSSHRHGVRPSIMKWLLGTQAPNVAPSSTGRVSELGSNEKHISESPEPTETTSDGTVFPSAEARLSPVNELDSRLLVSYELPTSYNRNSGPTYDAPPRFPNQTPSEVADAPVHPNPQDQQQNNDNDNDAVSPANEPEIRAFYSPTEDDNWQSQEADDVTVTSNSERDNQSWLRSP